MNASRLIARFAIKTDDGRIPAPVADRVPLLLLDTLGVALAGVDHSGTAAVRRFVTASGCAPQATLLGFDASTTASEAALVNGTAAHALDFDDLHHPWYGHPSSVLFPATLAIAERTHLSGRRLVSAYLVGLSVGHALATVLNLDHYRRGWHTTSTFGAIAAASACAHLLDLTENQTVHALGIAASSASGLRQNFGTDVKPLHAGMAARAGIQAVLLAAEGVTASKDALDGPLGFAAVFNGAGFDVDLLAETLDDPFEASIGGIGVKRYPSCGATHPAIDAMLQLVSQHTVEAAEVADIECSVNPLAPRILIYDRPRTPAEARFSLQFCVATAFVHRTIGTNLFHEDHLTDQTTTDLMTRVRVVPDPTADPHGDFATRIRVRLTTGEDLVEYTAQAKGKPDNPLTREEIFAKYLGCATTVLDEETARAVGDRLCAIDQIQDVEEWTQMLRDGSRR